MKIDLQKYIGAMLVLITLAAGENLSAQLINTESFDAPIFLPAGWSALGTTNYWSRRTTGTNPTVTPHSGAGLVRYDSRVAAAGTAQSIVTPVIDYSNRGGNAATFSLWLFRDTAKAAIADSLSIFINTSASLTGATELGAIARSTAINLPSIAANSGWAQYTFNVPAGFNTNTNYILLEGTSQFGNNIFIDDVQWLSYPSLCAGTPSAGTIIPNTPLICGGTGATVLTLTGDTTGYAGLTSVWESASSASGPWTVIDTAKTIINTGTITATTYYKYIVTCSYSAASDSTIDSVVVSSNPVPVVTITPNPVTYCSGSAPIKLVASGAHLFTWTPSTGLNTNIGDSVFASPATGTRYTATGIDSNGCYGSASVNMQVRRSPVAGIVATANPICPGDSTVLTDTLTSFGNTTFTWAPDGQTTAGITVTPTATTTYTATVTAGGCSTTDSIVVTINTVKAAFGYSANGTTVTFSDSSLNATGYMWFFGNGDTSTQQNPVKTYAGAGSDTVILIVAGVCNNDTLTKIISVYPTGIASISGIENISIWPNPATNMASVEFTSPQAKSELQLINYLGQVIENRVVAPKAGQVYKENLNLSELPSGVYLIRIITGQKEVSIKLIRM